MSVPDPLFAVGGLKDTADAAGFSEGLSAVRTAADFRFSFRIQSESEGICVWIASQVCVSERL